MSGNAIDRSVDNSSLWYASFCSQFSSEQVIPIKDIIGVAPWLLSDGVRFNGAVISLHTGIGCIVWEGGTWVSGYWKGGRWLDGIWVGGMWLDGFWGGGQWLGGTWRDGIWNDGIWEDGLWLDGEWNIGSWLGGIWEKGFWYGGKWVDGNWETGMIGNEISEFHP